MAEPPLTRSALLAARRAESSQELQAQYDVWARSNPTWAPRIGGPEAAAALGYASGGAGSGPGTRKELMLQRKREDLQIAVASSGFDKETQAAICQNDNIDPDRLVTNLARNLENPSVAWVDNPVNPTRTALQEARKKVDRAQIDHYNARYEREGHMDAQARSDYRVDQSIVAMREAGGGQTRSDLLASRRRQRMADVEAAADLVGLAPVPQFAEQEAPFWKVGKPEPSEAQLARTQSREELKSQQKWWAKPEQFPVVHPPLPREEDPFKLRNDEQRYLGRKLSSGPKKHQRGYAPEAVGKLPEKVTVAPYGGGDEHYVAPPRAQSAAPGGRSAIRPKRFSDMVFRFLPPEERRDRDQGPQTDGLQFTRPLYSSFSKSGIFEGGPPIPRGGKGGLAATAQAGLRRGGGGLRPGGPMSAPAGLTGGGLGGGTRPGTAQATKEEMRMLSLLGQAPRGKPPAYGVRSGGFQLLPKEPNTMSSSMRPATRA